jgi:hypothetical protein
VSVLDPDSVAFTVDRVEDAVFHGRDIPASERREAARWLADRQGLPGSYRGLVAPTEDDGSRDLRVYTGERVTTRAGRAHILGEEAGRALRRLRVETKAVAKALRAGEDGMLPHLREAEARAREHRGDLTGEFCCGACSVALWRHLVAGGFDRLDREAWLAAGMRTLASLREGTGWRRFPFHYTALLLAELDAPGADEERRHAAPRLERVVRRSAREDDVHARRRVEIAERILSRC